VFEETGIRAHFRGVLAFTYELDFRFEHSDVYLGCSMSLDENEEEQKINFDPLEIAACKWVSLDEWANSPEQHPVPITLRLARIAVDVLDGRDQLLESNLIEVKPKNSNNPPCNWDIMMYRRKHSDEK
jgi:NADH pyrophosphatase NudC (nudix superfamily)